MEFIIVVLVFTAIIIFFIVKNKKTTNQNQQNYFKNNSSLIHKNQVQKNQTELDKFYNELNSLPDDDISRLIKKYYQPNLPFEEVFVLRICICLFNCKDEYLREINRNDERIIKEISFLLLYLLNFTKIREMTNYYDLIYNYYIRMCVDQYNWNENEINLFHYEFKNASEQYTNMYNEGVTLRKKDASATHPINHLVKFFITRIGKAHKNNIFDIAETSIRISGWLKQINMLL